MCLTVLDIYKHVHDLPCFWDVYIYVYICFEYMIFLGLYNHEMIVYIVVCIWYMIVLVMEIVFDTISEDVVQIW